MKHKFFLSIAILLVQCVAVLAQSTTVSPSRLYFKAAPGDPKKQVVHVTNTSEKNQSYNITFGDFTAPGIDGKTKLATDNGSEHSCSKYLSASPSFFELGPGKSIDVLVSIDLPSLPESNKVKWGTLMLKIVKERNAAKTSEKEGVGMGLVETFQFVIHVFQTPPNITLKKAEITSFQEITAATDTLRTLAVIVKNTGEAILDCASYFEFSNLKSGEEIKTKPTAFTILPEGARQIKTVIPANTPKGKYTVTAVVDFGSREDVQAAQMDIEIK